MLQTLLVFGEGPTDMGRSRNAQAYAHGDDLEVGPMLRLGQLLGNPDYHRGDLLPVVNAIALDQLDMPTFNQCRNDVKQGIHKLCGAIAE